MPGEFSKANRPQRPGPYFNWEAIAPVTVPVATGSIVAIPFTHDWGPFEEPVQTDSFGEWVELFGDSDTPGYRAVKQAFQGEGAGVGRGGAGAVLSYRMGGSAAAKASLTIQNTAGTPADAITLTARYEGAKGNDINITSTNYLADSTKNVLIVYVGTAEVERYVYTDANINDLGAKINASSDWLVATVVASGTALQTDTSTPALSANTALEDGNDGSTLVSGDWTAALDALEAHRFGIFVPFDLTDSGIEDSIFAWAVGSAGSPGLNKKGRRFLTVLGGALDEDIDDAVTRAASFNDPDVVTVGVGSIRDLQLLDTNGDPRVLSTAQFAPRLAGILANRGEALSATRARLEDVELVVGPTEAEILTAFDGGVVVLSTGTDPLAPVRIEKALTTYTTQNDESKPYLIYRQPKYVRTMHGIETDITEWLDGVIGTLAVNDKVRDSIRGGVISRLEARVQNGVIQPGPTVEIDQVPPPSDDDEFVALVYGIKFGRSLEQVFNTVRVG